MAELSEEIIFKSYSYVEVLHLYLSGTTRKRVRKPRGSIQAFAKFLNCHPSFIAQVLSERAHLSVDQAILAAEHFRWSTQAKDHFLDLLQLERSGRKEAKGYFQKRIAERRNARNTLTERWQVQDGLSEAEKWEFFSSWVNQVVYSLIHIPTYQSTRALSKVLRMPEETIETTLELLKKLKLIDPAEKTLSPKENWLHLKKGSRVSRSHHQTWRHRAIEEFSRPGDLKGFHYSGAITVSKADAKRLREELLLLMDRAREIALNSKSEESYALNLDFFLLSKD